MKRIIALILSICSILSFTACSTKKSEEKLPSQPDVSVESQIEYTESKENESQVKEWGVTDNIMVEVNNDARRVFVNFHQYLGLRRGTGKLAMQDDTIMILDGQTITKDIKVESGKPEDVFPSYFLQTELIMKAQYIGHRKNFKFEVDSKENVTINGYDMCKFIGTHTYNEYGKDDVFSKKFVAYATRTKSTGAYVYWMVIEDSEKVMKIGELEDLGKKMAESFREETE